MAASFRNTFHSIWGRMPGKTSTYCRNVIDIADKCASANSEQQMILEQSGDARLIREWGIFHMFVTQVVYVEYEIKTRKDIVDYLLMLQKLIKKNRSRYEDDGYYCSGPLTQQWYAYLIETQFAPLEINEWHSLFLDEGATLEEFYQKFTDWAAAENKRLKHRTLKTATDELLTRNCHCFIIRSA